MENRRVINFDSAKHKHSRIGFGQDNHVGKDFHLDQNEPYVAFRYDFNEGGGGMDNYITRPEFDEHKRHLDSRFDGISTDIKLAKVEVINKIEDDRKDAEKEKQKERKSDRKWFISLSVATCVALLGLVLQGFNII